MLQPALAALSMLALAAPPLVVSAQDSLDGVQLAQVRLQQYIVIRVARGTHRAPDPAPPPPIDDWREKKGDKCIKVQELTPVAFTRAGSVDLVMTDGRRMRAKLDSECPALDFYAGFYLKPRQDGKICADRDSIRSRSGGDCRIQAFRKLVPPR